MAIEIPGAKARSLRCAGVRFESVTQDKVLEQPSSKVPRPLAGMREEEEEGGGAAIVGVAVVAPQHVNVVAARKPENRLRMPCSASCALPVFLSSFVLLPPKSKHPFS